MRTLVNWLAGLSVFAALAGVTAAQAPEAPCECNTAIPKGGPTNPTAVETYFEAAKYMHDHYTAAALDGFRKADKQDGGHCVLCELKAWKAATEIGNYKAAREQALAILDHVTIPVDKERAQYLLGQACLAEGMRDKHEKTLEAADAAFQAALQFRPDHAEVLFDDGRALAYLNRDEAATARFQQYLKVAGKDDLNYERAQRFAEHPEFARTRVAPNFRLTTLDGKTLTLESLAGKVVLIDFWATWCSQCRETLPHIRQLVQKFEGQPFVVLSISLDSDLAKWKDFMAKNQMTWLQYCDGGFDGNIATLFGVNAIPATFTIDAEGVLEDQRVGDAHIAGKLKKLVARAVEMGNRKAASAAD